jgi:hypothetical protein
MDGLLTTGTDHARDLAARTAVLGNVNGIMNPEMTWKKNCG